MLELRPVCENCKKSLPPNSKEAMICSYECTFCRDCVEKVLENVCPSCGGGFTARPIRPSRNWRDDNYLGKYPAILKEKFKPVNHEEHRKFVENIKGIAPENR